jgi:hypothetical protein
MPAAVKLEVATVKQRCPQQVTPALHQRLGSTERYSQSFRQFSLLKAL